MKEHAYRSPAGPRSVAFDLAEPGADITAIVQMFRVQTAPPFSVLPKVAAALTLKNPYTFEASGRREPYTLEWRVQGSPLRFLRMTTENAPSKAAEDTRPIAELIADHRAKLATVDAAREAFQKAAEAEEAAQSRVLTRAGHLSEYGPQKSPHVFVQDGRLVAVVRINRPELAQVGYQIVPVNLLA